MSVGIVFSVQYIVYSEKREEEQSSSTARSPLRSVHVPGSVRQLELRSLLLALASRTVLICDGHRYTPPPPLPCTAPSISSVPAACKIPPAGLCHPPVPAAQTLPSVHTCRASPSAQSAWRVPRVEPLVSQLLPTPHGCGDTLRDAAQTPYRAVIPHPATLSHPPRTHPILARPGPPHPPAVAAYQ